MLKPYTGPGPRWVLVALLVSLGACGKVGGDDSDATICTAPEVACGGSCVDLSSDNDHCGRCEIACTGGQVCGEGTCGDACPADQTNCSGVCANTETSEDHCGGCGNGCDTATEECRGGDCVPRCDTFLTAALVDDWGNSWDRLERTASQYDQAKLDCETFGGRLPTASEAHRVSTARTGLFDSSNTNEIWTLAPHDTTQQATLRLSSGAVEEEPTANSLTYRCVCPVESPIGFNGGDCAGPLGNECFDYASTGDRTHVDAWDRPSMRKNSAIWECAWNGAHLIDATRLIEGIFEGLPNGSNTYLFTADDSRHDYATSLRWAGAVNRGGWPLSSNLSHTELRSRAPFRCAGVDHQPPASSVTTGTFTTANRGYTADASDNAAAIWKAAHDACWNKGGHLARSNELGEAVLGGLPNGSNTHLFTADQAGHNGSSWVIETVRWGGVAQRFTYEWNSGGTETITEHYKSGNTFPFRCVYYPLDAAWVAPANCNGGTCTSFTLPGESGATMVFDSADRAAITLDAAIEDCKNNGAHLASVRDLTEAIRHGLPNGRNDWVWAADFGRTNVMMVRWNNPEPDYTDLGSDWSGFSSQTNEYRCMWTNELR